MAEERRYSGCAVQVTSPFSGVLDTINLASPFAEDAFVQDSICKFTFEI